MLVQAQVGASWPARSRNSRQGGQGCFTCIIMDPMPPKSLAGWLADGCPRRGLWCLAPAARATRASAEALIGSFTTRGMRRGPVRALCGPADVAARLRWPKLRDPARARLVTRLEPLAVPCLPGVNTRLHKPSSTQQQLGALDEVHTLPRRDSPFVQPPPAANAALYPKLGELCMLASIESDLDVRTLEHRARQLRFQCAKQVLGAC